MLKGAIPITESDDSRVGELLKENGLNLAVSEARRVIELLGRDPTLVELTIFNTMWSEHCSYKSSRKILGELLPTNSLRPGTATGTVW